MVAPRRGMSLFTSRGGFESFEDSPSWEEVIEAVDWNRVVIEAEGLHERRVEENPLHVRTITDDPSAPQTCGTCLRDVLLDRNWAAEGKSDQTYAPPPPPPPPEPKWPSAEWYEQFEIEPDDPAHRMFIIPLDEHEPAEDGRPQSFSVAERVVAAFGHDPLMWSGREIPPVVSDGPPRFEITLIDPSVEPGYCFVHACPSVVCRAVERACST